MDQRNASLLLVDDDAIAIRTLSRALSAYPHQRYATSGADALRLACAAVPDLILLDADMPDMTGLDVCDALGADPALAHVPVIIVTAHESRLLEAVAFERGAVDFVTKPPVAAQITARIDAALALRARQHDNSARSRDEGLEPARLLIVDDDATSIRVLRQALEQMGDVCFAMDAGDALVTAHRFDPDVILLDAQMPRLDGFELCRALLAPPAPARARLVMVTRFGDPRIERRAFECGAADFIVKPFAPLVMRARVRRLLEAGRRPSLPLLSPRLRAAA